MVLRVRNLMSADPVTLHVDENLLLADEIMRLGRLRHLPVVDDGGRLVGLITHRDILKVQASSLAKLSFAEQRELDRAVLARSVMESEIESVTPDTLALDAAKKMRTHKFGCLPVVEDGELVGIITEADFLDLAIEMLEP